MRVQSKLLLLLFVLVATFVTAILVYMVSEETRITLLVQNVEKDKTLLLDQITQYKGASLEQMSRHFSTSDQFWNSINNRDPAQTTQTLAVALKTYQIKALWVLDSSYQNLYSLTDDGVPLPAQLPNTQSFRSFIDQNHFSHFYLDSKAGLLEIRGASIHPSQDLKRATQPLGYLFIARLLDQEFLKELSNLTDSKIELQRISHRERNLDGSSSQAGIVNFSKMLEKSDGTAAAWIVGKVEPRGLEESRHLSNILFVLLAGFAILSLSIVTLLLNRWVRNPLYQLSAALDSGDVGLMNKLTNTNSEFGDLARLIEQFFNQKKAIEYRHRELVETNRLLGQANEEAKRLAREAEVATITKSEILANVSHEIRTPLNAIIGVSDLMLESNPPNEQREYIDTVKSSAHSLLEMIGELLDFSRIEAGKLDLAQMEFGLRDSVADTLAMVAMRAHEKGLELCYRVSPDVPDNLLGDARRLRQVLLNLVDNAIKFTNQGEIVVEVALLEMLENKLLLQFSVRDTGIGVPPDKHQVIFEPFTQVDSSATRRYRGAGLGLAISSRLVKMMGGRIWLDSQVVQGSTFRFTVRLQTQSRPSRFTSEVPTLRSFRALLVDDNAVCRAILTEVLESWGLDVFSTDSGQSAWTAIDQSIQENKLFNVALVDAGLPDYSPVAFADRLAATNGYSDIGLLFLASTSELVRQSTAHEVEHAIWLVRPPKLGRLQEALLSALNISSKREFRMERNKIPINNEYQSSSAHASDPLGSIPEDSSSQISAMPKAVAEEKAPSSANVSESSSAKIDEGAFMVRAGGDPQLACELIDLLFQQLPLLRADVDKALAARDSKALGRAAHTLKGSVGNFGARAAMELAKKLELSIPSSGDFQQAAILRSQLEQELVLLESELKALHGRLTATS